MSNIEKALENLRKIQVRGAEEVYMKNAINLLEEELKGPAPAK